MYDLLLVFHSNYVSTPSVFGAPAGAGLNLIEISPRSLAPEI